MFGENKNRICSRHCLCREKMSKGKIGVEKRKFGSLQCAGLVLSWLKRAGFYPVLLFFLDYHCF